MFQKIQKKVKELFGEKGQGIVEYALLLGFVGIVAIFLLSKSSLPTTVEKSFTGIDNEVTAINAKITEGAEQITIPTAPDP